MTNEKLSLKKIGASSAASWAWGTSLIMGQQIAQEKGIIAWIIWAVCNTLTLALFGWLYNKKKMSINHLFQNTVVFSNERRNIDPTSLLNFTISTVADNSYMNLFDSYITICLQGKVSKSSDVVSAANQKFRIKTNFQPSGLITNSKANYTYINTNGDLVTQELNGSNEYIAACRGVISQLFTPKRIHDQDAGFLENEYHSSGSVIFDNFIYFQCDVFFVGIFFINNFNLIVIVTIKNIHFINRTKITFFIYYNFIALKSPHNYHIPKEYTSFFMIRFRLCLYIFYT